MLNISNEVYHVKARIEREGIEPFWLDVGITTKVTDGKIILTLNALPLHSNGVLMLFPTKREGKE